MATDFVKIIQNAQEDATSLSEFVTADVTTDVPRRLAPDIKTLSYYVAELDDKVNSIEPTVISMTNAAIDNTVIENGVVTANLVVVDGDQTQKQLNGKVERTYSSVLHMLSDNALKAGEFAKTRGFYSDGDAGGANYKVITKSEADAANIIYGDGGSTVNHYAFLLESGFVAVITEQEEYCLEQFGAISDGIFDCHPSFLLALNLYPVGHATYSSTPTIRLRLGGVYYCSQRLNIKHSVKIYSDGSGLAFGSPATVRFAAGSTGFIVNRADTIDNTTVTPKTTAGDSSTFDGFIIEGARGVADVCGGHGIWMRARATVKNMSIGGFEGNGIHIYAASNGGADFIGNANNFILENLRLSGNKSGVYVEGYDANSGTAIGVDSSSNREWGIIDKSFLGNQWISCHVANNARRQTTFVNVADTAFYQASIEATPEQLVTVEPSTNNAVWLPALKPINSESWVAGKPVGYYKSGGGYAVKGDNNRSTFVGCYSEGGQGYTQGFAQHTIFTAGFLVESPVIGSSAWTWAEFGALKSQGGVVVENYNYSGGVKTAGYKVTLGGTTADRTVMTIGDEKASSLEWYLKMNADRGLGFSHQNKSYQPFQILGANSIYDANPLMALGKYVEGGGNTAATVQSVGWTSASGVHIPTSGTYTTGSRIYTHRPLVGDYMGVVCTTGGLAGSTAVFKKFGKIEA